MTERTRKEAEARAGYREKYAMENGTPRRETMNGDTVYIFTYSDKDTYQDANGATYDATRKNWIN